MADVNVPHLSSHLSTTVHQVTEEELPQYVERMISKFNIRSYAVSYSVINTELVNYVTI